MQERLYNYFINILNNKNQIETRFLLGRTSVNFQNIQ